MQNTTDYIVSMLGISKAFGGIKALDDVSLNVKKGEIRAIVGENGAGKSTLVKILSGAYKKDSGKIILDEKVINPKGTIEMRKAGISIIYQEFALAPHLTVAENIFLNKLSGGRFFISWKKLYSNSEKLIKSLGFDFSSKAIVGDLSVAYQQVVEIAKAINENAKVLILDEPTAVLSPHESKQLFTILMELKSKGVCILYISHKLDEVFELADTITVMRDGTIQGTLVKEETDSQEVVSLMLGRSYDTQFPIRKNNRQDEVVLSADNLNRGNKVKNISLDVYKGEILGIAGLVGSGKTELARLIFGADVADSGTIAVHGKRVYTRNPRKAVRGGIAYLPENRKDHGVILSMKIRENLTLPCLKIVVRFIGFISKKKELELSNRFIMDLNIKTNSSEKNVSDLSGGNQQKVSISKWLRTNSKVYILDEPTRGVDVGAKYEIYTIIDSLTAQGHAIIFISSEIEEIVGMCDRVLVLKSGTLVGQLQGEEISKEKILSLSVGAGVND